LSGQSFDYIAVIIQLPIFMDELAATKAFALSLIHFVAAFQLRRLHLFAILLLSSFMEKTRV